MAPNFGRALYTIGACKSASNRSMLHDLGSIGSPNRQEVCVHGGIGRRVRMLRRLVTTSAQHSVLSIATKTICHCQLPLARSGE